MIEHNKYNCFLLACVIVKRQTYTVDLFNKMCNQVTNALFNNKELFSMYMNTISRKEKEVMIFMESYGE